MNTADVYTKTMGVFLEAIDGHFYVVFNYCVYEVNEVGARIIDLCNGKNRVSNIVEKLSAFFKCEYDQVNIDVQEYIRMLETQKIITKC